MNPLAQKFQVVEEIGRGAYGIVYSAKLKIDYQPIKAGSMVAIKALSFNRLSLNTEVVKLQQEIEMLQSFDHPNIIKLYGVEQTSNHYYLIMEYCEDGDLNQYVKGLVKGLSEEQIRDYLTQIADGINYLHLKQIVHRDLKPHNILMKKENGRTILKIADFGFARFLKPADLAETMCGSPIYMAPEIQFGRKYTPNVDMWSIGVIAYEMVTLKNPFPQIRSQYDLAMEFKMRGSRPYSIPSTYNPSPQLQDLVTRLLTIDPTKRLTSEEFIKHDFIAKTIELQAFINNKKISLPKKRVVRYSFLESMGGSKDKEQTEIFLKDSIKSAETISYHFNQPEVIGSELHFALLVMLIEFLMDFVNEARSIMTKKIPYEYEIISLLQQLTAEATGISDSTLTKSQLNTSEYLFSKGLQYAKEGSQHEISGEICFAVLKYQKALFMLQPIAFSKDVNQSIAETRSIYKVINSRFSILKTRIPEEGK